MLRFLEIFNRINFESEESSIANKKDQKSIVSKISWIEIGSSFSYIFRWIKHSKIISLLDECGGKRSGCNGQTESSICRNTLSIAMKTYLSNSNEIIEKRYLQTRGITKSILNRIHDKQRTLNSLENNDHRLRLELNFQISMLEIELKFIRFIDQLKLDYKAKETAEENVAQRKEDQLAEKPQGRLLSSLDMSRLTSNYNEFDPKKLVQRQESIGQMFSKSPVYSDIYVAPHSPYIHDGKEFFAIDMSITA